MTKKSLTIGRLSLVLAVSAIFVLPVLLAVAGSLMPIGAWQTSGWLPNLIRPEWSNYRMLFQTIDAAPQLLNSLLVVISAVPLSVLTSSLAGFFIINQPQPWRRWLVAFAIVTMLVPPSAVWLFRFQLFESVGLLDSRLALMAPAVAGGNSLFVLIYFWAWGQIPAELFEAAKIDGAGFLTRWRRVAMPLVRPATAAVALLAFMLFWGNFIEPVLFIYDPNKYTFPIGLQLLNQLDSTNRPVLLAGAVVGILPAVLVFLTVQRWFLHGEIIDGA